MIGAHGLKQKNLGLQLSGFNENISFSCYFYGNLTYCPSEVGEFPSTGGLWGVCMLRPLRTITSEMAEGNQKIILADMVYNGL
jgi:hypothetical protein